MHRTLAALVALVVLTSSMGIGAVGAAGAHDGVAAAQTQVECEFPFEGTDATGEEVTIDEEPERVVAMQPSDAQTLWEIGAREKVVGMPVGQYTEYLEGHDKPEDVSEGDGITVSTEHVIDLEPDLVVASSVADEERVEQLRDAGLTVYQFEPETSIEDVIENTLTTGQLVGECEGANGTAEWMEGEIGAIEEAVEDEEAPLVLYAMGDGFTAGQGTFIEEIIETAGGENLGSSAGIEFYGQISEEVVIAEDPNWIVYPDNFEEPPVSEGVLEETTAGQEDRTVAVDAQRMNQPGPQVVYAIDALAEAFHPEAYAAMDEGEEAAETDEADDADETDDAADADETDETDDEEDDLPGFGIAAALVALLAAAFVLLRRR